MTIIRERRWHREPFHNEVHGIANDALEMTAWCVSKQHRVTMQIWRRSFDNSHPKWSSSWAFEEIRQHCINRSLGQESQQLLRFDWSMMGIQNHANIYSLISFSVLQIECVTEGVTQESSPISQSTLQGQLNGLGSLIWTSFCSLFVVRSPSEPSISMFLHHTQNTAKGA